MRKKKLFIEQKEEKIIPSGEDDSNETGKSLLLDKKVNLIKSFANINYFKKIIKDNQYCIIFSLIYFFSMKM